MLTGGYDGDANHTLTMNLAPTPGTCDVTPQSGNVDDVFKVTCTGFKDEDVDQSMTYSLYQTDPSDVGRECLMEVKTVDNPWNVGMKGLRLMEGGEGHGYQSTLVMKAKDYYGSFARKSFQLKVRSLLTEELRLGIAT